MGEWLNRFMVGKKKYSAAVIVPILVTAINLLVTNSETQRTLVGLVQEYLPTLIALVGGIAYTVVEGVNDNTRLKTTAVSAAANGSPLSADGPNPGQPQQAANQAVSTAAVVASAAPPWDMQAFDARVKERAPLTYSVANPSTEFYQALAEGQSTPAEHFEHVEAYWDYVVMKADARFAAIWGYSFREAAERVAEPGTPTYPTACGSFSNLKHKALALGEKYYIAYLDYDRARARLMDVRALAQYVERGFDWKGRLAPVHQNLYFAGEMSAELLKCCS